MDLSIIYVNWRSEDYLRNSIRSIRQFTTGVSYEIIVVDNNSPTGNVDVLKREFPEIQLIASTENLGFAAANNLGFRHSTGKYVLFLNPDTKLTSPAINILLNRTQSLSDAGIVGCKLLNADLSVQTSCIQNFPGIVNSLSRILDRPSRTSRKCGDRGLVVLP